MMNCGYASRNLTAISCFSLVAAVCFGSGLRAGETDKYETQIRPILVENCYGCHAGGEKNGNIALDEFEGDVRQSPALWQKVLVQLRSRSMPPLGEAGPSEDQRILTMSWIKSDVFNPGERNDSLARRRNEQKSVLDFVLEDARSMQRRLPSSDRDKLGQYLDGIRDIEKRIEKSERFGAAKDPEIETPAGVPDTYEKYIQLTYDLLFLAFQTDSTRVASLLLAHDGSNRSFDHIGIVEGHHDLTHHQNKVEQIKKVQEIDQWYVRMFSGFLDKLARAEDVDGKSLLYNSMIIYGSGNADGNRHTHSDLPIVLAGNAGGALTPGRFVDHRSKPLTNLYLSMADRMGVQDLKRFGDSTDRLGDL